MPPQKSDCGKSGGLVDPRRVKTIAHKGLEKRLSQYEAKLLTAV